MGPTGYGDSPYQSFSAYAGNPYLIDLDLLRQDGLLTQAEIDNAFWGSDPGRVDYGALYQNRLTVLAAACRPGLAAECRSCSPVFLGKSGLAAGLCPLHGSETPF